MVTPSACRFLAAGTSTIVAERVATHSSVSDHRLTTRGIVAAVTSMPAPSQTASSCPISAQAGIVGFAGTWLCAAVASSLPLVVFADPDESLPIPVLAASLVLGWVTFLVGATLTSRSHGSGDVVADLGLAARPLEMVGIPIGIFAPVALVPLVYVPLREVWPATFSEEALTETATDLVDRADGALLPLLILLVVIGAPLVEEIVYRGLLQRPLLNQFPAPLVIVFVAAVFALIHFRPVEYPGLFVAGLVFGLCAWRTGRVGTAVAAHVGFNLTGIVFAF
jgi:membrane protease YdiL (CAAX protease family)